MGDMAREPRLRIAGAVSASLTLPPAHLPEPPEVGKDWRGHLTTMFDHMPLGLTLADAAGIYLLVNSAFADLIGLAVSDIIGEPYWRFAPSGIDEDVQAFADFLHSDGGSLIRERTLQHADGSTFPALVTTSLVQPTAGGARLFLSQVESLAERRAVEASMLEVQSAVDGIVTINGLGRITSWNLGAERMLGYPAASMLGKTPDLLLPVHLRLDVANSADLGWGARMSSDAAQALIGGTTEVAVLHADGRQLLVELSLSKWEQDGSTRYTGVLRDITARRRTEALVGLVARAAHTANEAGSLVEAAPAVIEAICRYLGWTAGRAWTGDGSPASWHVHDHPHPTAEPCALEVLAAAGSRPDSAQLPVDERTRVAADRAGLFGSDIEQALIACDIGSAVAVPVLAGTDTGGVLVLYQPTEATPPDAECIQALEQIGLILGRVLEREHRIALTRHQAAHDPLTDLANRRTLLEHIECTQTGLADGSLTGRHALLLFDLDRFKLINDSLGHVAGDTILQDVATRITATTRTGDLTARLGGDEFVVLTHGHPDDASLVAYAHHLHAALTCTLEVANNAVPLRTSLGVCALIARLPCETSDPEAALRDADAALRLAKRRGKGRVEIFDAALRNDAAQRLRDETDLEQAINSDQLTVHYQPILDLKTGTPSAAEALVRWARPGQELIYPDDFIPLAEDAGLIVELGRWVLHRACADAGRWSTTAPALTEAAVSINVSSRQLMHPNFVDDVIGSLREAQLPAHRLILEVTESVLIEEGDSIVGILGDLRSLGIRIALDDFGKGYSSLSYLQRLPLDILKIDRSFIKPIDGAAEVPALSEVVLKLGQALDLRTIAEGVVHSQQVFALREMGCDYAQGFALSEPVGLSGLQAACESAIHALGS